VLGDCEGPFVPTQLIGRTASRIVGLRPSFSARVRLGEVEGTRPISDWSCYDTETCGTGLAISSKLVGNTSVLHQSGSPEGECGAVAPIVRSLEPAFNLFVTLRNGKIHARFCICIIT
jgi:hypothetical protein